MASETGNSRQTEIFNACEDHKWISFAPVLLVMYAHVRAALTRKMIRWLDLVCLKEMFQ